MKANLRVGEASHAGPSCLIPFGCSNPSGLRNKESHVVELGPGVWMLSETQLSSVTQASSKQRLQSLGRASQRDIRVHHGVPAALRSNSLWAGAWSGVCTTSDWTSSSLTLPWPSGLYQLGRAQVIQHVIESLPLAPLTRELVLGRSGPRLIAGDLNHDADSLAEIQIWKQQGWVDAQTLAYTRWGRAVTPTCKGSTVRIMFSSRLRQQHCANTLRSRRCFKSIPWSLPSLPFLRHVSTSLPGRYQVKFLGSMLMCRPGRLVPVSSHQVRGLLMLGCVASRRSLRLV